ncbi:hypothetical protein [Pseudomonas aeruginosa]|uniref:hypothetical protein n=1 Tax=Pseudomonas aeruginosa TaxID=287 RepID=UPI000DFA90BA|nr:hypothetical protein [Pseudomonas aeruginosa]SUD81162.1 Uncharacterised protein [Pseudomonas aeruginosa]
MADKLSLVGFISELGISRSLAGRCGHVSRERTERRTKALYMVPDGHVPVAEDLLRRIERECRRESDWNWRKRSGRHESSHDTREEDA